MNKSVNYPIIRMNNESIILIPGSRFSKNELKSRLHEMDIDASNVQDKGILVNLYESTLSDNQNKFKIFNRLRKDTEMHNSLLGISQRQSLQASNANTMSNNSKNKIINISSDVKPFSSNNNIQQDFNMAKSININTNKGENSYNYNIQEHQINNTGKFGYSDNQIEKSYNNYSKSRNFQNNDQSILNNSNKYNYNNSSNNNNYSYYNNASQVNFENNNDSLRNNTNNNMNNRNSINNNNSYKQKYKEEINTGINRNYNYTGDSSGINNKIFTNIETPNPQNYPKNISQSIFSSMINNQSKNNNNYNNNTNSFNSNNPFNQNNNNNNSRRVIIEEQNQSALLSNGETMPNNNRELDEESNYSIFSTFKNFKNSSFYKNRKQICFNIVISFIILSLVIVGFYLLSSFWDILTDPKSIIEGIFGFISSLFFGSIRYFYITIPIILLILFIILLFKKYLFKKQCEDIFKKVLNNLINERNSRNIIYEDDIFRRYAQNYGIKYEEFIKKYLPALRKMRRKDSRLKTHSERVNGKDVTYWELNN